MIRKEMKTVIMSRDGYYIQDLYRMPKGFKIQSEFDQTSFLDDHLNIYSGKAAAAAV